MGLFGGLLKGIAKIGGGVIKAVASKATGGLSDIALKQFSKGKTNQAQAATAKYGGDGPQPRPSKQSILLGETPYWAMSEDARYLQAAQAPRAPREPRPCKYGPRGADGYCPPKPAMAARAGRARREPRPCKYGPRGADGYCPPKPARGNGAGGGGGGGSATRASFAERFSTSLGKEAVQTAVQRALPRVTAKGRARQTRAAISEGVKQIKGLATGAGAKGLALGAAKITGLGAVGLGVYTLVRNRLVASMVSKQAAHQQALTEAFLAARDQAETELGRTLRPSELASLNLEIEERIGALP